MNNILALILAFLIVTTGFAQTNHIDETIIRAIADNVVARTTLGYQAVGSRATYNSIKDIPEGVEVQFRDHFTEWGYLMGVMNIAMVHLGEQLGDKKYINYSIKHVANGFNSYKYFQDRFKNDRPHYRWPYGQFWTMGSLDDCGAMSAIVIEVYQIEKR